MTLKKSIPGLLDHPALLIKVYSPQPWRALLHQAQCLIMVIVRVSCSYQNSIVFDKVRLLNQTSATCPLARNWWKVGLKRFGYSLNVPTNNWRMPTKYQPACAIVTSIAIRAPYMILRSSVEGSNGTTMVVKSFPVVSWPLDDYKI
uniref:Uncharacterized protein n=1 Tax=Pyxicephalus adspersus TaxID=30357 RepID=A0A499QMC5_PYXAD|nr:hypothetical protein maker-66O13-exonerate_protein2genome-gene-0.12 [Pyxicephalus adspersus]